MKRSGFTVLELLVASLLLSMLVTVLTMIFNQSSIAWRTGVAGVRDLYYVRSDLGARHDVEDDLLPGLGGANSVQYRTVSVFSGWNGSGSPQTSTGRLYADIGGSLNRSDVTSPKKESLSTGRGRSKSAFAVGVRSAGPDKKWDTVDDISTFPEEVN